MAREDASAAGTGAGGKQEGKRGQVGKAKGGGLPPNHPGNNPRHWGSECLVQFLGRVITPPLKKISFEHYVKILAAPRARDWISSRISANVKSRHRRANPEWTGLDYKYGFVWGAGFEA